VQLVFHSYHAGNIPSETFKAMRKQVGPKTGGSTPKAPYRVSRR
jgi:hypothetical protein